MLHGISFNVLNLNTVENEMYMVIFLQPVIFLVSEFLGIF